MQKTHQRIDPPIDRIDPVELGSLGHVILTHFCFGFSHLTHNSLFPFFIFFLPPPNPYFSFTISLPKSLKIFHFFFIFTKPILFLLIFSKISTFSSPNLSTFSLSHIQTSIFLTLNPITNPSKSLVYFSFSPNTHHFLVYLLYNFLFSCSFLYISTIFQNSKPSFLFLHF